MSSIRIKYAEIPDAELIADMSRQTFYDTFADVNRKEDMDKFMNEQFDRDTLIKEVGAPGNLFLLAYDGEEPLGYVRIREGERHSEFKNHTSIEIARIYATKSSIGKGVGKALMQECIRIAKDMKRDIIWLGVWEKNDRAIEFYRKWGFEKFAEHDFVLGTDVQTDWLMSRRVENL